MAHVNSPTSNDSATFQENHGKCEILNTETTERVRIVLFKECRFKERQLLFDSHYFSKEQDAKEDFTNNAGRIEVLSNKNNEEFYHLTEMIFGSAAMKYNETYYKIHNVSSPQRIIFTQVFAPRRRRISKKSESSFYTSKLKKTSSDLILHNSHNSGNSLSSLSDDCSRSDSFSSVLRDSLLSSNSTATTIDSGFSEVSLASSSSLGYYESSYAVSNTSLDHQDNFTHQACSFDSSYKPNVGYIRLGLALILVTSVENERFRDIYLQHITFVESILFRLRQYIEAAVNSPTYLVSVMLEISKDSAKWMLDLGNELCKSKNVKDEQRERACNSIFANMTSNKKNVIKFIQNKFGRLRFPRNLFFGKIESEDDYDVFCKLLKELDTKEKKFFLSTLLTSVLTHHTGWIATCYSPKISNTHDSYNALWRQLSDLYGATGCSRKASKTVIYGSKNDNVIGNILDFLRYFIRYFRVQKRDIERLDIAYENKIVDEICDKAFGRMTQMFELHTVNKTGLGKTKSFNADLSSLEVSEENNEFVDDDKNSVLFILGDNEKLENLKKNDRHKNRRISYSRRYSTENSLDIIPEVEKKPAGLKVIHFPLPKVKTSDYYDTMPFEHSFKNSSLQKFVLDMIIQGTNVPEREWKFKLLNDLSLATYPNDLFEESVIILGNTDEWDVQEWSSNRSRLTKEHIEENVDASLLVSNILEIVLQMWNSNIPKQYCMTFIEHRLQGICLKASALAQYLRSADFCTMDLLVSTFNLNVTDVPLLMSVASTLYPELSEKYGLSYQ